MVENWQLHRRITDIETDVQELKKHASAMTEWRASIDENTEVSKEGVEVMRQLISAVHVFGWIATGAKWVTWISAACAGIWVGLKWAFHWGAK